MAALPAILLKRLEKLLLTITLLLALTRQRINPVGQVDMLRPREDVALAKTPSCTLQLDVNSLSIVELILLDLAGAAP